MVAAVRVHKVGGPEVLTYEEIEVGAPGQGQIRVKQHACGVNFIDTAAVYGDGHSERLIGKAIAGKREKVAIASKIPPKIGRQIFHYVNRTR